MRIYRNHYRLEDDESTGYAYFTSRQEAVKDWNESHKIVPLQRKRGWIENGERAEVFEFKPSLTGILHLLNDVGAHPNNG